VSDEEPSHERHLASHIFNLAVMVVGGVALYFMMRKLGWDHFREVLHDVGWWFAVILGLETGTLCCDAAALNTFMRPEARMISYWRVLAAQASGRAINTLTPGGTLGEVAKVSLLVSHAPRDRVLSSIVLLNLANVYLSIIIIVVGTGVTLLLVDLPHSLKVLVAIGVAALVLLGVALFTIVRRGTLATVLHGARIARLIKPDRLERWQARMTEIDRHIRELQQNRSAGTWKGLLWVIASKCVNATTTMVMLHVTGVPLHPSLVIGVLSIGILVGWVAAIVPMGLGLADGGNYALYSALGATGVNGVTMTFVSRARTVSFALLGLVVMAALHATNRISLARMHRRLRALRAQAEAR